MLYGTGKCLEYNLTSPLQLSEIFFRTMGPKKRGRPKTKKAAPPPEDSADEILSDDLELKETLFPLTLVLFVKINHVPYLEV
jgi:hypothetical protein